MEHNALHLETIKDFINSIGIAVQEGVIETDTFLKGIEIRDGGLIYQTDKLHFPGVLLHEAGHIAVAHPDIRDNLQDDVAKFGQGPAEEMAAIAWSWAALIKLNLPPEVVFHCKGYKGASNSIIEAFSNSFGFGYPMLSYWQMCELPFDEAKGFPHMVNWLRPAI